MVVFYLRNSRAPSGKVVPITISLDQQAIVPKQGDGFPNLNDPEGDLIWLLTASTSALDSNGHKIPTEFINVVSEYTVHLELEAAIGRIGNQIDWGEILEDNVPPRVIAITPGFTETSNIPILSNISVRLQDPLPAAGMDLSTLNLKLNDFPIIVNGVVQPGYDVQIKGNVFDLTINHSPRKLLN